MQTNNEVAELVKRLPEKLRMGVRAEVLACAINEKVIELTDDGKLRWLLQSKTLQAYFCGRMWCGDQAIYSRRHRAYMWQLGSRHFPARDLERLFEVTGLRDLRRKRRFSAPPECFQLIEDLFDSAESGV